MKRCWTMILGFLLCSGLLNASTVSLTSDPASGFTTGLPGATTGWGFTLTWDSTAEWISVTGSALIFETNPALGAYTDFIGPQGGPEPFFSLAPSTSWSQAFNAATLQGIGAYEVAPDAIPFSQNTGSLIVFFDIFDGNPMGGGSQTGSSDVSTPFSVSVAEPSASIPEPSPVVLAGLGGFALALLTAMRGGHR